MKSQVANNYAFPANQKLSRSSNSNLLTLCLALISCNLASTQQPTHSNQISDTANQYHHHYNHASIQLKTASKVGLAPHDRPACQLLPTQNQRRHASMAFNQPDTMITTEELFNSDSQTPVVISNVSSISSPSVLELSSSSTSSNLKPLATVSKKVDTSERLRQLRSLLDSNGYDAYLVTPNDEHGSEYVTDYDRRLRFISGFSGSNGFALILRDRAVLFTDGRYAIQADQDLDCNWWLVVSDQPLIDIHLWLKANAAKGIKITTDARMLSLQSFDYLDDQIKKLDSEFALISQDLVDIVWNTMSNSESLRKPPQDPIFIHPIQFAGNISWQEKVVRVSEAMAKLKARHYIVSQLDDIAWLLNLRGNDIPMSPLFKSYLLISRTTSADQPGKVIASSVEQLFAPNVQQPLQSPQVLQVATSQSIRLILYIDLKKVNQQIRDYLHADNGTIIVTSNQAAANNNQHFDLNGSSQAQSQSQSLLAPVSSKIQVELKDYDVFIMDIRDKLASVGGNRQLQGKLLLNAGANVAIHVLARSYDDRLVLVESIINKLKSVKSDDEVQGMRLAHWRDSLAISMLLAQLDMDIGQKQSVNKWTEVSAAKELKFFRSLMDHNKGESFDAISAYGSNAAIVHYKPNEDREPRFIRNESTYLLDSGGQYLDGTTDITRTLHYGEPSEFERETYTRVLMGAIDMMSLIFDESSRAAYRLNDLIARRHLFEIGLDYMHGTGHGIGSYSMVHEAPALIDHYTSVAIQKQTNANKQAAESENTSQQPQAQISSEPVILQANMFTSIEPGYYKANDFGIRLENVVVTQRVNLPSALSRPNDRQESSKGSFQSASSNERQFLRFEPISLVPFEPKLIKLELLSNKQKAWLNSYNLMVRIRMTHQINYYLSKIRKIQTQPASIPVQGTTLSSKLYQQFIIANNTIKNDAQLGYYNFLSLESNKFQEKLEQAHRWIMSKTELIPLDVPPAMLSSRSPQANELSTAQEANSKQVPDGNRKRAKEAGYTQQRAQDGHKLMLAYMSSMPFNDLDAAEVVAAFQTPTDLAKLSARSGTTTAANDTNQSQQVSPSSINNKCSGYECDLWLLNALNAHSIPTSNQRQQRHRNSGSSNSWTEQNSVSLIENEHPQGSFIDGLFQLDGNQSNNVSINMWSLVVLGLVVVVQMSILTYMCTVRSCNGSSRSQSLNA